MLSLSDDLSSDLTAAYSTVSHLGAHRQGKASMSDPAHPLEAALTRDKEGTQIDISRTEVWLRNAISVGEEVHKIEW